ncbi:sensor histidine kinase [Luteolibacter sp. AS25]|uniref:sensor histidine kinase n=1 Tax=Luteolibacter sp. AS25 TaxID=3135776 RepID=UPI00398AE9DC
MPFSNTARLLFTAVRCVGIISCFLAMGASLVRAENLSGVPDYSDQLYPDAIEKKATKTSIFGTGARMKQLRELLKEENRQLEALTPLRPAKQLDSFGYHSDYVPIVEGIPEQALWKMNIDAGMPNRRILGVVLIPTIDERSSVLRGYAFPKRFRISSINSSGKVVEVHADWTTRDFPDPGMRPVIFRFPSEYAADPETISRKGLRLEVFGGEEENGLEYFSLARIHLIRTDEIHWPRKVKVSSSFESAPYWGVDYLSSSRHTLGMPLSARNGNDGNLVMELPTSHLKQSMVIRVELEDDGNLGWLNLFPGNSPDGIDVPGYGFPKSIVISRLVKRKDKDSYRRFSMEGLSIPQHPGNNMIRLTDLGRGVSALEISCNDFPVYQGKPMFSLGEVEILSKGKNISRHGAVSLHHVDLESIPELDRIVDGRVDGRDILSMTDWIDQLAAAKPHENRVAEIEAELRVLSERWQRIRFFSIVSLTGLVVAGIMTLMVLMLRGRKKAEMRLRKQINSDLHDEVGSNLGSISLMAGQLEEMAGDDRMRDGLSDLSLMAREACASLREVVWVVNQRTILLPLLLQRLGERAERVLNSADLVVEIPDECPKQVVSLTFKRHLVMFFKEAVHNCARHAGADVVKIKVSVVDERLRILVQDNGAGFDISKPSLGWGLESMKQRAKEMNGGMEIISRPDCGTTIVLDVPLRALSREPNKAYKTSN